MLPLTTNSNFQKCPTSLLAIFARGLRPILSGGAAMARRLWSEPKSAMGNAVHIAITRGAETLVKSKLCGRNVDFGERKIQQ